MKEILVEDESLNNSKEEGFFKKNISKMVFFVAGIFLIAFSFIYIFFIGSFGKFSEGKIMYVKEGMGVVEVSKILKSEKLFPGSLSILAMTVVILGGENKLVAGPYLFTKEEGIFFLAKRLISGDFKIKPVKITIPEGFNSNQISKRIKNSIPVFDSDTFLKLAAKKEGHLFPDTYFVMPDISAEDMISMLNDNFDRKISKIKKDIIGSGRSFEDIVTMASVLEEEVRSFEDKKIVSGIFWKRIKIGMPIQADSTLKYERGLASADLSINDLQTDSPFNTYTNKGLPPSPISNPGIESIMAAISPTETQYLYFLTDKDGNVHYAKTFAEHKANAAKYLR